MNYHTDFSSRRQELRKKPLLNLTETRLYLGLSRRDFEAIERHDPTFPRRKTKTKHSTELLDQWLATNGVFWWKHPDTSILSSRAVKFKSLIDRLN